MRRPRERKNISRRLRGRDVIPACASHSTRTVNSRRRAQRSSSRPPDPSLRTHARAFATATAPAVLNNRKRCPSRSPRSPLARWRAGCIIRRRVAPSASPRFPRACPAACVRAARRAARSTMSSRRSLPSEVRIPHLRVSPYHRNTSNSVNRNSRRRSLTRSRTNTQAADTRVSATTRRLRLLSRSAMAWTGPGWRRATPSSGATSTASPSTTPRWLASSRNEEKPERQFSSERCALGAPRGASRGGALGRDERFSAATEKGETGGGFGRARAAMLAKTRTL